MPYKRSSRKVTGTRYLNVILQSEKLTNPAMGAGVFQLVPPGRCYALADFRKGGKI